MNMGQLRGDEPMHGCLLGVLIALPLHFEAPPRAALDDQLAELILWFNQTRRVIPR